MLNINFLRNLRVTPEPTRVLSDISLFGRLQTLPTKLMARLEKLTRDKHSSFFVSDEYFPKHCLLGPVL